MAARQIGLDQVATAIQEGNVNLPTGSLSGNHKNFTNPPAIPIAAQ
ncbi:hypothetical protein [Nostoc sp.]